jgi:hypothetical protein
MIDPFAESCGIRLTDDSHRWGLNRPRTPTSRRSPPCSVACAVARQQPATGIYTGPRPEATETVWSADSGVIAVRLAPSDAIAALGLTHTHYDGAAGFAPATVSTAADQTVLAEHALTIPALARIVAQPSADLPVVGLVHNYNTLLGTDGSSGSRPDPPMRLAAIWCLPRTSPSPGTP